MIKRAVIIATITIVAASVLTTTSVPAGADGLTFVYDLNASTHIKKLNRTIVIPRGTFTATIDFSTGNLTGSINLPTASTTIGLLGYPLVTAKFKAVQTRPVTGHIDFSTFHVTATAVFDIRIPSATPLGTSINLVGTQCHTSTPVHVTMSGQANLSGPSTFTGIYTIPSFATCQAATTALNLLIPGPGNTFTAVATPR